MKKLLIPVLLYLILTTSASSLAQTMDSTSYTLELNQTTNGSDNHQSNTVGSLPEDVNNADIIKGDNFIAYISYDNEAQRIPFVLSSSASDLNFGTIEPGEGIIRTQSLSVIPASAPGYQVLSYENHNLRADGSEIPGTSCDNGSCNQYLSDFWAVPLTYGFGYSCENVKGKSCEEGFTQNKYKRFSNNQANELPSPIITVFDPSIAEAVLSYKINVSGNQPQKPYQNTIYHIAVPAL